MSAEDLDDLTDLVAAPLRVLWPETGEISTANVDFTELAGRPLEAPNPRLKSARSPSKLHRMGTQVGLGISRVVRGDR